MINGSMVLCAYVFFVQIIVRLVALLTTQFEESDRLEGEIKKNFSGFGFDV